MPEYVVHLTMLVSTGITVEASSPEQAIELAYESPDMPGSMGYGAFSGKSVDQCGEWIPAAVSDAAGNEVWSPNPGTYELRRQREQRDETDLVAD